MTDKFTAAESIRRLAQQYAAMVEAADALEKVGKMEQTLAELKKEEDRQRNENAALKGEATKAKKAVADADAKAIEIVANAVDQAEAMAADVKRQAEETAAGIIKSAQDDASKTIADIATDKARLSSEIGGLQRAIEAARSELLMLQADGAKAEEDAKLAQAKLEKVQAQIRKLAEV
jgi:chromosome segregation ATPase